ncbi:hypothetical protein NP233_g2580 [Leucocoprinus birnbaumii]|uniref:Mitochondrial intermediate peptidase n=1 Tax=Leucocoprinus birnbaumii TaxID=56174 RepID=A0AAD5VY47_9AGAR|nr:hypothetical protein NP233_g2580 [Leucocoprinus birnbaumii]
MPYKQAVDALKGEVDRLKLEITNLQITHGAVGNIKIGNYILTRLAQLGVTKMFGLPGDFNLGFLDLVEDHPDIDWVGNCNELNAAYAADGYARVKQNSLGVVLTTFGVGELSAMNGIAGAFSEMVPVLHLVGVPSTSQQSKRPILHHTLGDGRYDAYTIASKQFTISQTQLMNKHEAALQIDHALVECITRARPVYMTLPTDMVHTEISGERLKIPLARHPAINDPQTEEFVLDLIQERVKEAGGDMVVLLDACVIRFDVQEEVKEFLKQTGFPVYAAPMGKTAIDEGYKRYGGIYIGTLTHPLPKERIESAKLIMSIGSLGSDFNTGNFSYNIPTRRHIELHSDHTRVQYGLYSGIGMKQLLPKLTERLQHWYPTAIKLPVEPFQNIIPEEQNNNTTITHRHFWPRVGQFFLPKDVIVTETGTSNFGILDTPLPDGAKLVSQILWGSIGWSVGSALGAAFAARELGNNRVILFVGEGSLQLTVQELSPMIRHGLKPIIFVLNNSGYTIERYIHGKARKYNDVDNWKWTGILDTFGANLGKKHKSYKVESRAELDKLLNDSAFAAADMIQLVEVIMPALDAPQALERQAEMTSKGRAAGDKITRAGAVFVEQTWGCELAHDGEDGTAGGAGSASEQTRNRAEIDIESFRSSARAKASIFSTAFASSAENMSLVPPQSPIDWNHSAEDITRLTQKAIDADRATLDKVGALDAKDCNFDSVFTTLAYAETEIDAITEPLAFYQNVSTSKELRDASNDAEALVRNYGVESSMRLDVFKAKVAAKENLQKSGEWEKLSPEQQSREKLKELKKDLSKTCLDFSKNFNEEKSVITFTLEELKGVPSDVISGYTKRTEDGKDVYDVTYKTPDIFPIFKFAENPVTRQRAQEGYESRLSNNVPLLDKALELRREIAKLLGYNTWADYITEVKMIKSGDGIKDFLNDLESKLRPVGEKELKILLAMKEKEHKEKNMPFDGNFYIWDYRYYDRKYIEETLSLDDMLVKEYFPVSVVVPTILQIYQDMLSVKFVEIETSTWHPDVQKFAVWEKDAKDESGFVGYCYLDLFPRESKYSHAAVWPLLPGYELANGKRSYPTTAMVANLAKPTGEKPALMRHDDVVTFFHEMGHVFHGLLSRTRYARFHGTSVARDFVEAPSQMLENWCWEPKVLEKMSSHYQKKEPLGADLIEKIIKSRYVNVGLFYLRQLFFAKFDYKVHTDKDKADYTQLWNNMREQVSLVKYKLAAPGQGTFGHITGGYDAGYYGYTYSLVFAADMYSTIFKADPLDPGRGNRYREEILLPGGSREETDSLKEFLGRPPNSEAFLKELFGDAAASSNL